MAANEITESVIGVPGNFDQPQRDAVRDAAHLAGFKDVRTIPEPVLAALAYGLPARSDTKPYLCFDMGAGTTDIAILKNLSGELLVEDVDGDTHLGGQDMDWDLVEGLLAKLSGQYDLTDLSFEQMGDVMRKFSSGVANEQERDTVGEFLKRWGNLLGGLVTTIESAKKELSIRGKLSFALDPYNDLNLGLDRNGRPIALEAGASLTREELERVAEKTFRRAIRLAQQLMDNNRLRASDFEGLLLIGGPTQMPLLRRLIGAQDGGLGVPLIPPGRVDAITGVAYGAAIFSAGEFAKKADPQKPPRHGRHKLILSYKHVTPDFEVNMAGRLSPEVEGAKIVVRNSDLPWHSEAIPLKGGTFRLVVPLRENENKLNFEINDAIGAAIPLDPDEVAVRCQTVLRPTLERSIGIGLIDDSFQIYLQKGARLPIKWVGHLHELAAAVRGGNALDVVSIPIRQGQSEFASELKKIRLIRLDGEQIGADLDEGSPIKIRMAMTEDHQLNVEVEIESIKKTFEVSVDANSFRDPPRTYSEILRLVNARKDELDRMLRDGGLDDNVASKLIGKLAEATSAVDSMRRSLQQVDAGRQAEAQIDELSAMMRRAESGASIPGKVREIERLLDIADVLYHRTQPKSFRSNRIDRFREHLAALNEATTEGEALRTLRLLDELESDASQIVQYLQYGDRLTWEVAFDELIAKPELYTSANHGKFLVLSRRGRIAKEKNNLDDLRDAVNELSSLLPPHRKPDNVRALGWADDLDWLSTLK